MLRLDGGRAFATRTVPSYVTCLDMESSALVVGDHSRLFKRAMLVKTVVDVADGALKNRDHEIYCKAMSTAVAIRLADFALRRKEN